MIARHDASPSNRITPGTAITALEGQTDPMAGKRKRRRPLKAEAAPSKRVKVNEDAAASAAVRHPTLSLYYPCVFTLREHVLSRLPASSKTRRRKVAALGRSATKSRSSVREGTEGDIEAVLVKLLDCTLVCRRHNEPKLAFDNREKKLRAFCQRTEGVDESSLLEGNTPQSEVGPFLLLLVLVTLLCPLPFISVRLALFFLFGWKVSRYIAKTTIRSSILPFGCFSTVYIGALTDHRTSSAMGTNGPVRP